jgi:CheY-like chemotaxis protein
MDRPFQKKLVLSQDLHRAFVRADSFIQRSGFQVATGGSGEELVAASRQQAPDAIMFSYDLEGLKGDEVCRLLKRNPGAARGTPVLIVGPAHSEEIADRCRRSGCDEYLGSTLGAVPLLQRLAAALGIQFRVQARIPAVLSISVGRIVSEFLGYSRDISEGGILVESALPIASGRRLNLRLFMEESPKPLVTGATVLRSQPSDDDDQFLLGMRFQGMDPAAAARLRRFIQERR